MGTGSSKHRDGSNGEELGGQLYVSLRMENWNNSELIPHVYGSVPIIGSWNSSKALSMERDSASTWELSSVVPSNHETLDFKFLVKPKDGDSPCIVEEGPSRVLKGGTLEEDMRVALFKTKSDSGEEVVINCRVFLKEDLVSPFDLASSWRAYQENFQPSRVRGIPDVVMNVAQPESTEQDGPTGGLELDLEQYVIPAPTARTASFYAANVTEDPRSKFHSPISSQKYANGTISGSHGSVEKDRNVRALDRSTSHSVMTDLKSTGITTLQKHDGQRAVFVERGVGSPRIVRPTHSSLSNGGLIRVDSDAEAMPAAAGAVAAAAVADQMHEPKEHRNLAIVLVGLPARGKTFTAAKLTRYLRWLGHETKHFNVGKYRRIKHGANQAADFFRPDNHEGIEARNEVAALAMEDMLYWMQEGGQVGIFDATNSTKSRRNLLMKMAAGKCKIIFLETICNDERIIERNIRLKVQQSPDYANEPDFEAGLRDFKERLKNYEKVYEPVEEGSYVKMIDIATEHGGRLEINNISGYLPGRMVFFLVNTHLTPRPILLTRHGESLDNVRGRIGGDSALSEAGELYSKKLANFIEKRLKSEKTASIWTSTLQRSILTASPIVGFPKIQWRALDEINVGACDGMTYEEIKKNMPDVYEQRKKDKLRNRYPRGESYLDVIQRLEPVIIELERQRAPVVVIAHQAVLRALYAYFADRPLSEIPQIEVPLHTIIEIQMGVTGVQEKRYKLMDGVQFPL
ncbi:6-phosphofructo-2-kinase/fructose-2,6-bisphosphatase-like isoform X1 [Carex rostrata]